MYLQKLLCYLPYDTTTTKLFEYKHKTAVINIEEMHIMKNIQIEETYIM